MPMTNDCGWDIPGAPTQQAGTNAQIRVIPESEERFIKSTGLLEHPAVIHRRASVGPENFLRRVILPYVFLHGAAAAILTIPVNQVPHLVDDTCGVLKKDFAGHHADA